MDSDNTQLNVLGTPLELCCGRHRTGFFRDGYCRTDQSDQGKHVVCARVTQDFLEFSFSRGNDLITPRPEYAFPGLKEGDCWCLCVLRWKEAFEAGKAPEVDLLATHSSALEFVSLQELKQHAVMI